MFIISKIIAAIMAFFMALIPGYNPEKPKPVDPPVQKVQIDLDTIEVVDVEAFLGYEESFVFTTYDAWKASDVGAESTKYGSEFFKNNSLAVIEVCSDCDWRYGAKVKSAYESGSTVFVNYEIALVKEMGLLEISCDAVLIPVSKNVTRISATLSSDARAVEVSDEELKAVEIIHCMETESITLGDDKPAVFSTYKDWKNYVPGYSDTKTAKYDKAFFNKYSLAAIEVTDANDMILEVISTAESGNVLKVEYSILDSFFGFGEYGFDIILVPVSKNITKVDTTISSDERVYKTIPVNTIKIVRSRSEVMDYSYTSSEYVIISTYEAWKACGLGKNDTTYDKAFFEEKSLVVSGVLLGNSSVYIGRVWGSHERTENTTLNLSYTLESRGDLGATVVSYEDIIVPVDKNVTSVVVTSYDHTS